MTAPDVLREHWRRNECLHVNGIAFHPNRVVLLTVHKVRADVRVSCVATPLAETTVASVLHYDHQAWVSVTATERIELDGGLRAICGEGAMGNEGFVAVERDGELEWVLFCSLSNPFCELRRREELLVVSDGYEATWNIPIARPEQFFLSGR